LGGQASGVRVAISCAQEFAFELRGPGVMKTGGGGAGFPCAVENARLFQEEKRRFASTGVLNIFRDAISSQIFRADAGGDVRNQKTSNSITTVSGFWTHDDERLEIRARAGTTAMRVASGSRWAWVILGRVAGRGANAWCRARSRTRRWNSWRTRHRVLLFPIIYGETLLGCLT